MAHAQSRDYPAFTCVVPIHARADAVEFLAAMASLAASRTAPDAIMVCHDGGVEGDLADALADACRDLAATEIETPPPGGLPASLNHAISQTRTPWIARFDGDDLNLPDRFDLQLQRLIAEPTLDLLGGDIEEFFPDGKSRRKRMPRTHDEIVRFARWRSPVNHMTVMFRRSLWEAVGGYPLWPRMEDYGLWLRMIAAGGRLANLDAVLVRARLGAGFHARRSGLRNLGPEWSLFRAKLATPRVAGPQAALALAARCAALAAEGPARLVYEQVLRR